MFYVYILKSQRDNKLYTGSTNNLRRRLLEHNKKRVYSTKHRAPFYLIYYEAYLSEKDARRREKSLKLRGNVLAQLKRRLKGCLEEKQFMGTKNTWLRAPWELYDRKHMIRDSIYFCATRCRKKRTPPHFYLWGQKRTKYLLSNILYNTQDKIYQVIVEN